MDHIKVVLKSGTKHTSQEKLRALNLLDLCLVSATENQDFVKYA